MSGELLSRVQSENAVATERRPVSDPGSPFAANSRFAGPGRVIGGRNRSTYEQSMATNFATDTRMPLSTQTSGSTTYTS
jgi:hypothetical protein